MAKIIKEHKCDSCDETAYFVRLAEPQPVKVLGERPFMVLAEYAVVHINEYAAINTEQGERPAYGEVTVMVADAEENEHPGPIYVYNRARTLDEVLWTIGGEYDSEVKTSATA